MTHLTPLQTPIAAGTSTPAQALSGPSTGIFGQSQGGNFWDILLSGLTEPLMQDIKPSVSSSVSPAPSPDLLKSKQNPLASLQLALLTQGVDEQGNIILPQDPKTLEQLQTRLDLTNRLLNKLETLIGDSGDKKGLLEQIIGKLKTQSTSLQASLSLLESGTISKETPAENIPFNLFIALGLNPSEISELSRHIDDLKAKLGREITVDDLIAGVGSLISPAPALLVAGLSSQPSAKKSLDTTSSDRSEITPAFIDGADTPTDELAARLNALSIGGDGGALDVPANDPMVTDPALLEDGTPNPLSRVLETLTQSPSDQTNEKKSLFKDVFSKVDAADLTPAMKLALEQNTSGFSSDSTLDRISFQPLPYGSSSLLPLTPAGQAAGMLSANLQAGQTHPATHMVAAQLTKAGKDGGPDKMTIQLDPPELGAVNIRLEINKDKTVKAVITAEKPETYLMLQRDSFALERALTNAGLDARSSSLSFELSDGNNNFFGSNNNGEGGGEQYGSSGQSQTEDQTLDMLSSSATWQIDPETGNIRYNIFA